MGSLFRRLFAASALCLLANAMVTALLPLSSATSWAATPPSSGS